MYVEIVAWGARLVGLLADVFNLSLILFSIFSGHLADMFEIWKNGIQTAAYALICALSRFQKHSSERGLVRYSLFLATYHGLKVISYGMGTAFHICFHLIV